MENNFIDYNDNWSNGSGLFGGKIKEKLGIGTGAGTGLFGGKIKETLGIGTGAGTGLFGGTIKQTLGIGDGKVFGKVTNVTKNAQYEAEKTAKAQSIALAKARADADFKAEMNQIQADAIANSEALDVVQEAELKAELKAEADATKRAIDEQAKLEEELAIEEQKSIDISKPEARLSIGSTEATKKSNKILYIGVGVLVIGIVAIILITRKK
jgi:hypothetical protein